jgi:hypothetical protein
MRERCSELTEEVRRSEEEKQQLELRIAEAHSSSTKVT